MLSRALWIVALAATPLAVLACSSDSSSGSASASSSAPITTTTATSTTAPPTTADPIVPAASGADAAGALISAWRNGDQAAAEQIATPQAVAVLFAAGEPGRVENRGCNSPPVPGPILCVYRTAAGELQIRAQPRPDGWYVDQAIVSDG